MKKPQEKEKRPFREILNVLSQEDLIRLRRRLERKGKNRVIALLSQEIERKQNNGEE